MITKESDNLLSSSELWQKVVMKYNKPSLRKSLWQISNSVIPFMLAWFLMYKSLAWPYWTTLLISVLASGFLIRIFIIFHDCGHDSFFRSKKANSIVGKIMGIMAFTPFDKWHSDHHVHHSTSGNLDKRGVGDVWTMTVEEYLSSSNGKQFIYRAFRNPFFMFTIGPLIMIFFLNRFTKKSMQKKEKYNVYFTNIAILMISVLLSFVIGLKAYIMIQLPLILISHALGLWLFYVQHQFDEVFWERNENWDYETAAIQGSSFLKLPIVLQWFTGNIGFHHVHHLSSRIPNYNLSKCHYENEIFKSVKPIRWFDAFKTLRLNLWDEANRQLISFKKLTFSRA